MKTANLIEYTHVQTYILQTVIYIFIIFCICADIFHDSRWRCLICARGSTNTVVKTK